MAVTIEQQLTALDAQRDRLAQVLTNKGVSAAASETLNSLVDKVDTLPSKGWITVYDPGRSLTLTSAYKCTLVKANSQIRITFSGSKNNVSGQYSAQVGDPACGLYETFTNYYSVSGTKTYKNGQAVAGDIVLNVKDGSFELSSSSLFNLSADISKIEIYV